MLTHAKGHSHKENAQVMREDVISAAELGADGIVAGLLTREGEVHESQLSDILLLCRTLVSHIWQSANMAVA